LGELDRDLQTLVENNYLAMESEDAFDAILDTSVPKLAVASLLQSLGVEWNDQLTGMATATAGTQHPELIK